MGAADRSAGRRHPWDSDPVVAAGTGVSALDESYDEDSPGTLLSDEGEVNERIREALRADSATSRLADALVMRDETIFPGL